MTQSSPDKFETLVVECREKNLPITIHNASKRHALTLFKNLFQAAIVNTEPVKIVSGNLDDDFYNDLDEDLKKCLDKDISVEVFALNHRDLQSNKFAQTLITHKNGTFNQFPIDEKVQSPHFILVGENKYRAETDHVQAKAIASFNNSSVGETLSQLFSELKEQFERAHSSPLAL